MNNMEYLILNINELAKKLIYTKKVTEIADDYGLFAEEHTIYILPDGSTRLIYQKAIDDTIKWLGQEREVN